MLLNKENILLDKENMPLAMGQGKYARDNEQMLYDKEIMLHCEKNLAEQGQREDVAGQEGIDTLGQE
jgi:hypothetical protein